MYPLLRPLLFRLDPERAHVLTLLALQATGGLAPARWMLERLCSAPCRPVSAFGLTFKNPVGLAAGYDKDALAVRGLAALGFGHIEIGTVTPRPQAGNPRPRLFRLVEEEALINRLGFPSRGAEFVQRRLRALRPGRPAGVLQGTASRPRAVHRAGPLVLGVNIGRNRDTSNEEAVFDYLALLQSFAPLADYLAINVSSPNTEGLLRLQERRALAPLLSHLHQQRLIEQRALQRRVPLLVKLGPDLSEAELDEAVGTILDSGMDGIIITNTSLGRESLRSRYRGEAGGLSGAPLRVRSEAVLRRVVRVVNGRIPIVSAGGIMSVADARRRLDMGATLVQLYTGLIYQGPALVKAIVTSL